MIKIKSERVLLVAPNSFAVQLLSTNKEIRHITCADKVFPTLHEIKPTMILFDHSLVGKDSEKMLRRLRANDHYKKVKICCYKAKYEPRADDFLKCLGVDQFIYQSELAAEEAKESRSLAGAIGAAIDASVMRLVSSVAY